MYKLIGYSNASAGVKEFVADTEEDLEKIQDCEMGSTCLVLGKESSKLFIKNGKGEWQEWIS